MPFRPKGSGKGARGISRELRRKIRRRRAGEPGQLAWSMPVGGMTDAELNEVLAYMAEAGVRCVYEREFGFVVHFLMVW